MEPSGKHQLLFLQKIFVKVEWRHVKIECCSGANEHAHLWDSNRSQEEHMAW
jgi:hypothetical protein